MCQNQYGDNIVLKIQQQEKGQSPFPSFIPKILFIVAFPGFSSLIE